MEYNPSDYLVLPLILPCKFKPETKKELRKIYNKEYYEANKEKLNAKKIKKYYEANKEQIKLYHKEYYEANKEKIITKIKKYYDDNKECIDEYKKQKITCECGSTICNTQIARHEKSKKHCFYVYETSRK